MYNRLKSSLLNHFHKGGAPPPNLSGLTKEEKKRLRHSLAECHLTSCSSSSSSSPDTILDDSAHCRRSGGHAPLAPAEEYLDESSSSTTFYSDLLATSFSTSTTTSTSFSTSSGFVTGAGNYCDYDDQNDLIMASPSLSWNVQYVGSFPISNTDNLGRRVDNFQGNSQYQNVELAISIVGVRILCEKTVLMSHSLRRVTDSSARPFTHNVAYVATEPAGRTYRRLCHVFHCQSLKEAEEIENVLRNTNQQSTEVLAAASQRHQQLQQRQKGVTASTSSMQTTNPASSTMTEKRSASSVLLTKLLGKKGGSQTVDETGQCKRKRRPVSAVFSSALNRLSSSTSSVNPKRMSTIEASPVNNKEKEKENQNKEHLLLLQSQMRCTNTSPVPEEPRPTIGTSTSTSSVESTSSSGNSSTGSSPVPPAPPKTALVFDDKLGEWIFPIDATVTAQLDNCSYFVGYPTRDSLCYNLMTAPEGAFVLRYSESKSKCLALSMRVPTSHNPAAISHYLIIRNEQGFRLKISGTKKPFPTLQMMLTHHSVLESNLPCTLHFAQWNKASFKQQAPAIEKPLRSFNRHSTALTKIDENRNLTTSTPYRRCGDDFATPKRARSRHEMNAMRRSHFFDDRHIVL